MDARITVRLPVRDACCKICSLFWIFVEQLLISDCSNNNDERRRYGVNQSPHDTTCLFSSWNINTGTGRVKSLTNNQIISIVNGMNVNHEWRTKLHELCERIKKNDPSTIAVEWLHGSHDAFIQLLVDSLCQNTVTLEFHLYVNQDMGKEGFSALAHLVEHHTSLEDLCIDCLPSLRNEDSLTTNLGREGFQLFGDALSRCKLKSLELQSFHLFGDMVAATVAKGLAQNESIRKVNLSHNKVANEGACAIANMLKVNRTIVDLDLRLNSIDNVGIQHICNALEDGKNTTLQRLFLFANPFSSQGIHAIGKMLQNNNSLRVMNLRPPSNLHDNDEAKMSIVKAMKHNFVIEQIFSFDYLFQSQQVDFYCFLNTAGRRAQILRHNNHDANTGNTILPDGLWAYILAYFSTKRRETSILYRDVSFMPSEILFYYVKSKPDLFIKRTDS